MHKPHHVTPKAVNAGEFRNPRREPGMLEAGSTHCGHRAGAPQPRHAHAHALPAPAATPSNAAKAPRSAHGAVPGRAREHVPPGAPHHNPGLQLVGRQPCSVHIQVQVSCHGPWLDMRQGAAGNPQDALPLIPARGGSGGRARRHVGCWAAEAEPSARQRQGKQACSDLPSNTYTTVSGGEANVCQAGGRGAGQQQARQHGNLIQAPPTAGVLPAVPVQLGQLFVGFIEGVHIKTQLPHSSIKGCLRRRFGREVGAGGA